MDDGRTQLKKLYEHSAGRFGEAEFRRALARHLLQTTGLEPAAAEPRHWLHATAALARRMLLKRWAEVRIKREKQGAKEVCYLSMEFLVGRLLTDTLRSLGILEACRQQFTEFGCSIDDVAERETDPGLGNGGLGRLAACLLDSTAVVGVPAYGYGIRYEFGIFAQRIEDGWQKEEPDAWLRHGAPWEFPRPDVAYRVKFHGRMEGDRWVDTTDVGATAFDVPVPGYRSESINTLRLWSVQAPMEIDLALFNDGNYLGAVSGKAHWESLTRVLYPHDGTIAGRELRFKQEHFFVSASLQDIIQRLMRHGRSLDDLPRFVAIQINDTHPAMSVAELMRLLIDEHAMNWDRAWHITLRTISYTNHTLMPEALETWPLEFFERMLPRHLQIICRINHGFLSAVASSHPGDHDLLRRVSLIDETDGRRVRMAHLAFVGSHHVNGVSQIHTRLMRETAFADLDRVLPKRIVNITNGIAPRRWLAQVNPGLSQLVSARIGDGWMKDLDKLRCLAPLAEDGAFRAQFLAAKDIAKRRLAEHILATMRVYVDPNSLFDVQIKRIHEYKRQLLKVLHAIALYNRIRRNPGVHNLPRTIIIAGKAAPSYKMAKLIIKLVNDVARVVNNDPIVGDRLKLLFLPNYGVSLAEKIVPATDLSEQISTAGTEASGTGNMKLSLNGALTIGTLDGANLEIRAAVGAQNFFSFGLTAPEVVNLVSNQYDPTDFVHRDLELEAVIALLAGGFFSPEHPERFREIVECLTKRGEKYCVLADFRSYLDCQDRVDALYLDREEWSRRAILNVAHMGMFSSDRAVAEYAREIWLITPSASETARRP